MGISHHVQEHKERIIVARVGELDRLKKGLAVAYNLALKEWGVLAVLLWRYGREKLRLWDGPMVAKMRKILGHSLWTTS